jgi:hypothetical protein
MQGWLRQNLSVEVDEWLIGRGCIELNPNTTFFVRLVCTLITDGDYEGDEI